MTYDYTELEKILLNQEWKAADDKTLSMMLAIAGRTGWFDRRDLENFPCQELQAIDQLWVKYSNGHFGLSVQSNIFLDYQGLGYCNSDAWEYFARSVGWLNNDRWLYPQQVNYSISAPKGHLPFLDYDREYKKDWMALFTRVYHCQQHCHT